MVKKFIDLFKQELENQAAKDDEYSLQKDIEDNDVQYHGGCGGHEDEDAQAAKLKNYNASMKKLKAVTFVSVFFIAA